MACSGISGLPRAPHYPIPHGARPCRVAVPTNSLHDEKLIYVPKNILAVSPTLDRMLERSRYRCLGELR